MLSINTNLSSLITQRSMKSATNLLNQAVERMSTGYKVNHAKDNAAAYSIITNMDTKINAYQVAEDNCAMGLDLLTTATESLDLIYDKLTRLRDLAEQASNGTYGEQSLKAINSEANALVDEMNRIYSTAEYNGMSLFDWKSNLNNLSSDILSPELSKLLESCGGGFIKEVEHEDTSSYAKVSSITDLSNFNIAGETYSISTAEELRMLEQIIAQDYSKWRNATFILANDIDMKGANVSIDLSGGGGYLSIDGNGYVISNYKTDKGLFDGDVSLTIKDMGVENVVASGTSEVGALIGWCFEVRMDNCYSTGTVKGSDCVGGLLGYISDGGMSTLSNCYSECDVIGNKFVSGLAGQAYTTDINSCYTTGKIKGTEYVGGIAGVLSTCEDSISLGTIVGENFTGGIAGSLASNYPGFYMRRNLVLGKSPELTGVLIGHAYNTTQVSNCAYNSYYDDIGMSLGENVTDTSTIASLQLTKNLGLQIGINSGENSRIDFEVGMFIANMNAFRQVGKSSSPDILLKIDKMLEEFSAKQVELGSVSNRLDSALNEISTQYENLVSSRSTLRDADIAEVSSEYIQQQILQQASATLMATANQMPSIALQLI